MMRTLCSNARMVGTLAGFSLLELMVSLTVFVLVAGAVVTTLTASNALNSTNRETILAAQAAESVLEALKGTPFDEVFVRYNDTTADDPAADPSPGAGFAVSGLDHQSGDMDGFAGEIRFPGGGAQLLENVNDLELGLPMDLSGDGIVDAADHAGDYRILPVRVAVRWHGNAGDRRIELVTVLCEL